MATIDDFLPRLSLGDLRINVDKMTRRIAFRIASWNDVHSGHEARVRMPRKVNVDAAHVGHADLEDGSRIKVATLPMHTMHAAADLSAAQSAIWYENSGTGVARVRYSIDDEGIRADGILYEDITDEQLDRLTASAPSGDWRAASLVRAPQDYEHAEADFAGACIVNVPGFSGSFSKDARTPLRLVASATSIIAFEGEGVMSDAVDTNTVIEDAVVAPDEQSVPEGCDGACKPCSCGKSTADDEVEPALTAAAHGAVDAPIEYDMEALMERVANLEELISAIALSM